MKGALDIDVLQFRKQLRFLNFLIIFLAWSICTLPYLTLGVPEHFDIFKAPWSQ